MTAPLVVSVHDVAPATAAETATWLRELDARGIPATLLVVPGPWHGEALHDDPALVAQLHDAAERGHEISLHGYDHTGGPGGLRNELLARGCAEFASLGEWEALSRLQRGRAVLRGLGFDPIGFTPPGWLASPGTRRALRTLRFRYLTSHLGVRDLVDGTTFWMPAFAQRPGGFGERAGAALVRTAAPQLARRGNGVRIALHPDDLARPSLRAASLDALDEALGAGARPMTYADVVGATALGSPRRLLQEPAS
jgi:predicted deacetylase